MSSSESDNDSFEHYCVDCKAIVNPYDKICANCGADISKFIEDEDSALEAESFFEELLPNEKILSNRKGLTLTTHRIRYQSEVWGSSSSSFFEPGAAPAYVKDRTFIVPLDASGGSVFRN